jgi:hypothetical protein
VPKFMTEAAVFIFRDLARNVLSSARYAKYMEWVENAERVRRGCCVCDFMKDVFRESGWLVRYPHWSKRPSV